MSRERGLLVPPIVLKMGSISHLRGFQYLVGLRFKSHGANTACVERSSVGWKADRTCILGSGNDNKHLIQSPAKWKRDYWILVSPVTRTVAVYGATGVRLLSIAFDLPPATSIARSGHRPPLEWHGRSRCVLVVLCRRGRLAGRCCRHGADR